MATMRPTDAWRPTPDSDEFKFDAAAVAAEEAVERKEAQRVKPWLSEFDVPERQELAPGGRPAGVESPLEEGVVEEHQDTNIDCFVGTRYITEHGSSARCHVDHQPRNQTK
jgi:hypothetical protein